MVPLKNLKCKICKKSFSIPLYRYKADSKKCNAGKFCSRECFYKSPERSPNKGKFGEKSNGWKGGIMYERGYRLVMARNHPHGVAKGDGIKYIREHRLIVEKHIGRYLKPSEVVHHINENPLDNRIENLMIMSKEEHNKLHQNKYWEKYFKENPKVIKKCIDCKIIINKKSTRCIHCFRKFNPSPIDKYNKTRK